MPGHWDGESPIGEGGKGGLPTPLLYFSTSTLFNFEIHTTFELLNSIQGTYKSTKLDLKCR